MAGKRRLKLEQIRIASPCPTSWENMIGDERIRFCDICARNVYNLSCMTRREAELLINEMDGRLCGMIYLRKDGSVMTSDCPVGLAAIRNRIYKRFAAVAAMVVALFSGGFAMFQSSRLTMGEIAIPPNGQIAVPQQRPGLSEEAIEDLIHPMVGKIAPDFQQQSASDEEQIDMLRTIGYVSE